MSHTKKFFLVLLALILGTLLLLGKQISRAFTITTAPTNQPLISPLTTDIPSDSTDPIFGNPGAALSIVEFTDIGCAECQRVHHILTTFIAAHPKDARLIWKDAPNRSIFLKENIPAHVAAFCAEQQNKFWEYTDAVMADKKYTSTKNLIEQASKLALDIPVFEACLKDPASTARITSARILAQQLGITTAPVLFVNNRRITLTKDIDLTELLEAFIAL